MAVLKRTRAALLTTFVIALTGVQVAEAAKTLPLENRVQRLERMLDNRVLIQLLQRIEGLQQEMRELRGQIELQTNEMEAMNKRNRDLYLDTDSRLQAIEGKRLGGLDQEMTESLAAVASDQPESSALVEPPTDASGQVTEKSVYDKAYSDLVNGRYNAAAAGFRGLLSTYPEGELVDNSRYWLGETYYVESKFEEARAQFEAIVEHSPESPKVAEAHLKLGFVLHEQGEVQAASTELRNVLTLYPDSTASLLAERRLEQIKAAQ